MRHFVMHLHANGGDDPREEAYLHAPGLDKVVIPVPIDLLPEALPVLAEGLADLGAQPCPCCGEPLADPAIAERFSGRG